MQTTYTRCLSVYSNTRRQTSAVTLYERKSIYIEPEPNLRGTEPRRAEFFLTKFVYLAARCHIGINDKQRALLAYARECAARKNSLEIRIITPAACCRPV